MTEITLAIYGVAIVFLCLCNENHKYNIKALFMRENWRSQKENHHVATNRRPCYGVTRRDDDVHPGCLHCGSRVGGNPRRDRYMRAEQSDSGLNDA